MAIALASSRPGSAARWIVDLGELGQRIDPRSEPLGYVLQCVSLNDEVGVVGDEGLNPGNADSLLRKVNPDSVVAWERVFTGSDDVRIRDVVADSNGDLYVVGNFKGRLDESVDTQIWITGDTSGLRIPDTGVLHPMREPVTPP